MYVACVSPTCFDLYKAINQGGCMQRNANTAAILAFLPCRGRSMWEGYKSRMNIYRRLCSSLDKH